MGFTISQRKGELKRRTLALGERQIENDIFTPLNLAKESLDWFVKNFNYIPKKSLEPCAGKGDLVKALRKYTNNITSIELNYDFEGLTIKGDFFEQKLDKFDFIYANFPFTPIHRFQRFFEKSLSHLKDDGYMLIFAPVYWLNNSDKRIEENEKWIEAIRFLPKMSFGRPMHNALVVVSKRKSNDIVRLF